MNSAQREVLNRCPLFEGVPADKLSFVLRCLSVTERTYEKGEAIFREGEEGGDRGDVVVDALDLQGVRGAFCALRAGEALVLQCAGEVVTGVGGGEFVEELGGFGGVRSLADAGGDELVGLRGGSHDEIRSLL